MFSASYYLHSPSTASGACYRRSVCIDMDMSRLVAVACCNIGWISAQHGVLCDYQCQKRLEACTNAEGGHSEHLLWHYLPDIPVATHHTHHNRFFSEPLMTTHNWLSSEPPTFERTQQTFSEMKRFCNSQVSVVIFSGAVGKWITVFFFWDNINNQNYVWIILLKMTFCISQGKVATSDREVIKSVIFSCQIFSWFNVPKNN